MRRTVTFLLLLAAPAAAAPPLTLGEVLASSRAAAPQIMEALAKTRSAEGKALSAQGAFDAVIAAEGYGRASGYYNGRTVGATITKPLEDYGINLYGGYSVSAGRFPIYEDKYYTDQAGEFRVGAVMSLLRDRAIDQRRFDRTNTQADAEVAKLELTLAAVGVQRRAVGAYLSWVAAGLRRDIYRDLLSLAEGRLAGLKRQVAEGQRPAILITENEQNILRRRGLVARAEADLARAANTLSFYWRDAEGLPRLPAPDMLPGTLPPPIGGEPAPPGQGRVLAAARPDLRIIDTRLAQAERRLLLDRNSLLPRLDVRVELSKDLGPLGVGGKSRGGPDTLLGFKFSLPLEQRTARGKIEASSADVEAQRRKRQYTEEQIANEIDGLAIDVNATFRLRELADSEQQRALQLAQAERRRFESGASDFFLVNQREETAANARVQALDTKLRQLAARAEFAAATADLGALGLQ